MAAFRSDAEALRAPVELSRLGLSPSILEFLDLWTVKCVQEFTGRDVFQGLEPHPVILIELDGDSSSVEKDAIELNAWLEENSVSLKWLKIQSGIFVGCKKEVFTCNEKLANTKLNEDVVVPLVEQINLVKCVNDLRDRYDLNWSFGHCGDGNLHVNFMYDHEDQKETEAAVEALKILMMGK